MARPSFTIGIEEEYLIVDPETRDLVRDLPAGLMAQIEGILGKQVAPEFLRSQIEVGTVVSENIGQARADLSRLRRTIADVAGEYGLAPIASSTHPFAIWWHQEHTDKDRYNELADAMGGVVKRLLICGMHVHVGIEDEDLRIDLMNQVLYFPAPPAGTQHLFSVLARPRLGPKELPDLGVSSTSSDRHAR